jgi:energy-coupling factor transport system permease protein
MRDVAFGQYYPSNSVVHRLDSRLKILLVIAYITMVFFVASYVGYAVVAFFVLLSAIISRVPLRSLFRSIRGIIYLVIFTSVITILFYVDAGATADWRWGWITFYKSSLHMAAFMALRLMLLVLGPSLLTLTTTPMQLTDGLEWLLAPLKLIRLPVHTMVLIMSIALRMIPTLIEEADKIIAAQKARCADFESKNLIKKARSLLPVLIPLFVSSFRRSDELAEALEARCYRGAKGRTRLKVLKFAPRDAAAALYMAAFFTIILAFAYGWWGVVY